MRAAHQFVVAIVLLAVVAGRCDGQFSVTHGQPNIPGLVKYVQPEYPRAALIRGVGGRGLFRLTIDSKTGEVEEVKVLKSTGVTLLNESCAKAMFSWRFQPGSASHVVVPFEFHTRGYSRVLH